MFCADCVASEVTMLDRCESGLRTYAWASNPSLRQPIDVHLPTYPAPVQSDDSSQYGHARSIVCLRWRTYICDAWKREHVANHGKLP